MIQAGRARFPLNQDHCVIHWLSLAAHTMTPNPLMAHPSVEGLTALKPQLLRRKRDFFYGDGGGGHLRMHHRAHYGQ